MKGYSKLKGYFVEHGIKQQEIADLLKIGRSTLNVKLNRNGTDFTMQVVRTLCRKYKLDANIFFLV